MKRTIFMTAAVAIFMIGCGGGSDDGSRSDVIETQTGYLVDAPVSGVTYRCGDINGTTDQEGKFECAALPVTFSIGGIRLGAMSAIPTDGYLFPQDLVGVDRDNFNDAKVKNMAVLLQSLDSDGDPGNGIEINATVLEQFQAYDNLLFEDITDINQTIEDAGYQPLGEEEALSHLEDSYALYSDDLRYITFTSAWLNGKTLYRVAFDEGNQYIIRFAFTETTLEGETVMSETQEVVGTAYSGTYTLEDGYLNATLNGETYLAQFQENGTADYKVSYGTTADNGAYVDYWFLDGDKAEAFTQSEASLEFSAATIEGKTFYLDDFLTVTFNDSAVTFASLVNPESEYNTSVPYAIENGQLKFSDITLELLAIGNDTIDVNATDEDGTKTIALYTSLTGLEASLPTLSSAVLSTDDAPDDSNDTLQRPGFELTNISARVEESNLAVTVTASGDIMEAINSSAPAGYSNTLWINVNNLTEFGLTAQGTYVNTDIYEDGDFVPGTSVGDYVSEVDGNVLTFSLPLQYAGDSGYLYLDAQTGSDMDNLFDSDVEVQDEYFYDDVSLSAKLDATNTTAAAYTQTDLEGTWRESGLATPINASASDASNFYIERLSALIDETGSTVLTYEDGQQESLTATIDPTTGQMSADGSPAYIFMNADKNFMAGLYLDESIAQSIQPMVKLGTSYAQSDLTGQWIYTGFYTPNSTPNADHTPAELFWIGNLDFSVASDGSATYTQLYSSLDENDSASFALTVDASGQIAIDGTGNGAYMNAGKDIIVSSQKGSEAETNENGLTILVKKAASYSQADLTGTWNQVGIWTPRQGNAPETQSYGYDITKLVIDAAGNAALTFVATSESNAGDVENFTATMAGDGTISIDGSPEHIFMNASKTVMVSFSDDTTEGTQMITVSVKQE